MLPRRCCPGSAENCPWRISPAASWLCCRAVQLPVRSAELNHPNLSQHAPEGRVPAQHPRERTSFWCGELLNFTAWPISSPVGYNHLKLVVAVRKQPGHYAPVSVSRKTHILPFFGDPQVLQQTTVSPEIGLQETCMASEAFPI